MLSYINFLLKRKYEIGKKLQTFEKIQKNKKITRPWVGLNHQPFD